MADSLANLRSVGGMEYNRTSGVRKRSRCDDDDDDDYEAYAFGDYSDNDQFDFHDWKFGLLHTRALGVVTLSLMNSEGKIKSRACDIAFDRYPGGTAPVSNGFVVSGKYAYISLTSGEWGGRDRLVCLDMDAEKFKFCDDPRPITTTIEPEVVSQVEEEHVKACDSHFMKAIERLWGYVGCICRDRYIWVGLSLKCETLEIHVSPKLSSIRAQLSVERLEELEVFVNGQLKDYSYLVHAWTLPYDTKEEDTFSIFICYMTAISDRYCRLFVCNFELVDQSETTDSIDDASASAGKKSRYTFKILSCASDEDFLPDFGHYAHAFTRGGSNFTLNNW